MMRAPDVNDMCLRCGTHWHGVGLDVKVYTRKEWDAWVSERASVP